MTRAIKKQILLTAAYLLFIAVFLGGGLYLKQNPISWQTWKRSPDAEMETAYIEYAPAEVDTFDNRAGAGTTGVTSGTAIPRFHTTARASVFTFSGTGSEEELEGVLKALKESSSTATFFVTAEDLSRKADQIHMIRDAGQSLGISVQPKEKNSVQQLLAEMNEAAEILRSEYAVREEIFVRQAYGNPSSAMLRASEQGGFRVLTELKEAVPDKAARMSSADEVIEAVFNEDEGVLQRGEIVHFQMGLFQYDDTLLGRLVGKVVSEKCIYPVTSAAKLAEDTESMYSYPVPEDMILQEVRDKIYPGHLTGKTPEEIFEVIREGYLGINWVSNRLFLPGFSDAEVGCLDHRGIVDNDGNHVFLTFDDWGTDRTVDELLRVLDKHDAKATFFVRTEFVENNPNLLRAIAEAGHTIGDHSHRHLPLSNEETATSYSELSEVQCQELEDDLVESYQTLQKVIGDMRDTDGKPSLSLLFRPPTLAVGRNGLETVFDCGFTHAISGYYSTADYKATDTGALMRTLKQTIRSGAVYVMHFSDNAAYTAEAVDMLLTELEENGSEFRFVGLNTAY